MNTCIDIVCKGCGKVFTRVANSNKYCPVCQKKYNSRRKTKSIKKYSCQCKNCAKLFDSSTKKDYCSTKCETQYADANKKKEPLTENGKKSIDEILKLARVENLTYGEYFKKYGY